MNERHPTLQLGAFVLEILEPDERRDVEDHLRRCRTCALEVDELQSLPAILGQLSLDDVVGVNAVPVPTPVRPASARPGRLRVRPRLVAAAAVFMLASAGVGLGTWAVLGEHAGPVARDTASADHAGVSMTVALEAATSRTVLHINVAGLPVNEHCTLVAVARDGSRHPAGHWVATYSGNATVTSSTDVPLGQLQTLQLLGTHGQTLVDVHP